MPASKDDLGVLVTTGAVCAEQSASQRLHIAVKVGKCV
jgi:hypothetical protein